MYISFSWGTGDNDYKDSRIDELVRAYHTLKNEKWEEQVDQLALIRDMIMQELLREVK
jgi:hypothetical protein